VGRKEDAFENCNQDKPDWVSQTYPNKGHRTRPRSTIPPTNLHNEYRPVWTTQRPAPGQPAVDNTRTQTQTKQNKKSWPSQRPAPEWPTAQHNPTSMATSDHANLGLSARRREIAPSMSPSITVSSPPPGPHTKMSSLLRRLYLVSLLDTTVASGCLRSQGGPSPGCSLMYSKARSSFVVSLS